MITGNPGEGTGLRGGTGGAVNRRCESLWCHRVTSSFAGTASRSAWVCMTSYAGDVVFGALMELEIGRDKIAE